MMAVCGVLERKGRVLLCKRLPWVRYPGLWELPTFEFGGTDTAEDSLEQGFFERISVKIVSMEPIFTQNLRNMDGCRIWTYKVNRWKGDPFLSGYGAYRFVSPKNLRHLSLVPGHVTLVKNFFSFNGNA